MKALLMRRGADGSMTNILNWRGIGVLALLIALATPIIPTDFLRGGKVASDDSDGPVPFAVGQRIRMRDNTAHEVPGGARGTVVGPFSAPGCWSGAYEVEYDNFPSADANKASGRRTWCQDRYWLRPE